MKQKIKLRGHLKSYLQVTLILGILLAAVNAGIYFININVCFSAEEPPRTESPTLRRLV